MKITQLLFLLTSIAFSTNSFANESNNASDDVQEMIGSQYSQIAYEYFTLHKDKNIFIDEKNINEKYTQEEFKKTISLLNKIRETNKPCPHNGLINQCLFSRSQFLDFNIKLSSMILNGESKPEIDRIFKSKKLEEKQFQLLKNMLIEQATRTKL
ncbi:hypothetical protein [Enterobacter bugandensis]|uniref:hypothetical protein n=1 Tax=Enterobacter bugandensis TaxID=881260 RepID=UPI002362EA23|nr:hypothetical protein [Enterobacter bugandensis]